MVEYDDDDDDDDDIYRRLGEVRRKDVELVELKSGHLFYYRVKETGRTSDVGFLINKRIKDDLIEVESTSDRAARLVVQLTQRYQLQIVQAYAATSSHTEEDVEEFYEEIKQLHTKRKQHIKLIMGDFNARIGQQEQGETSVGKYEYWERNELGDQLIEFA